MIEYGESRVGERPAESLERQEADECRKWRVVDAPSNQKTGGQG